jgi:ABC-type transport system substrate-binding protein
MMKRVIPVAIRLKSPWGAFMANLDEIVVREVPEASTRLNALRTGEVNFTHFPVLSQVDNLKRAGIQMVRVPQPGFSRSFPMNVQRPPTDDVRVRRAIIHALNRDQIVRSVLFDLDRPDLRRHPVLAGPAGGQGPDHGHRGSPPSSTPCPSRADGGGMEGRPMRASSGSKSGDRTSSASSTMAHLARCLGTEADGRLEVEA